MNTPTYPLVPPPCAHSQPRVLIFPIDMPYSITFLQTARQLGVQMIAASSEAIDPKRFPDCYCVHLPYVTTDTFDRDFIALLETRRIDIVFAPHIAVWRHLRALLSKPDFPVRFRLCNESPLDMNWRSFDAAYHWAEICRSTPPLDPGIAGPALPLASYAGLFRQYNLIPGESDDTKLFALTQVARQAPPGDVVEIGSLYGKSAFALAWLAKFHHLGTMIAVDPWRFCQDQGEQAALINDAAPDLDWKHPFLGFMASLAMFEHVNYLRHPSVQAADVYQQASADGYIDSEEFGRTPVTGKIAILHIDGNHTYESVRTDLDTWLPFVQDGGWILFDDYQWAFGDGPKQVGDEFLTKHPVQTSFVTSDTLFVKI